MTTPASSLLALALLIPAVFAPALEGSRGDGAGARVLHAAPEMPPPALGLRPTEQPPALRVLEEARGPEERHQVRIESRVIIRISPAAQAQREQALASLPRRPITTRFAEIEHGDCVPVGTIVGFQALGEDRLLLFLRDHRILSAALDRACNAQSFYSGFYIERSEDGKLCVARDRLQSRSGASCEVAALRRLVAVRD